VNLDYDAVPCQDAYEANGRKAGTYVKQGVNWVLQ
jgi:hypothetical protein